MLGEVVVPLLIIGICVVACIVLFTVWRGQRRRAPATPTPDPNQSAPRRDDAALT